MKTIIWRIHDHKPGHANQTRGLVQALSSLISVECHDIAVVPKWRNWVWGLTHRFPPGHKLPKPDFILGAGHATHQAVLAARRVYGGKTVILMKPSLPLKMFDLCIVPEHDGVEGTDVICTRGVLNAVEPSVTQQQSRGLMLIGGPSANSGWDNDTMIEQVLVAAKGQARLNWILTTSRRTPADFVTLLSEVRPKNLTIVPCEDTEPGWVPQELSQASQVWVSEDSVSMVYEALTSGAAVGLLTVPGKQSGRVARGMNELQRGGWVTRFRDWDRRSPLPSPPEQLYESQRCAAWICERFHLPCRESRLAG